MDKDFEKNLKELIQKSKELARQSEELAGQTDVLMQQFRERKKKEVEEGRKKLGST
jgi:hypothetical protein